MHSSHGAFVAALRTGLGDDFAVDAVTLPAKKVGAVLSALARGRRIDLPSTVALAVAGVGAVGG